MKGPVTDVRCGDWRFSMVENRDADGNPITADQINALIAERNSLRTVVDAAEEYKNAAEVYMMMSTTSSLCSYMGSMCSKEQRLFAVIDEMGGER